MNYLELGKRFGAIIVGAFACSSLVELGSKIQVDPKAMLAIGLISLPFVYAAARSIGIK